ncbi:MAG: MBL fold metallo-hydrolase, partial [Ignavibacteria bacterium]|nr:MBL fold metallo-hydrolase [Ignavibacteria bacterium]
TIYHTGDTGLFGDMKLIGELNKIDYLLLPIGDNFTMGIDDALIAVDFIKPKVVIPMHYNTFPVINSDPKVFAEKVKQKGYECKIIPFNETIEI